ncbi:MAG TPA: TRAP transporter small permease [Geminicoccaceae bacterium]|nr:TRAP transporter small permease [Geminicoccaceae bacterium]
MRAFQAAVLALSRAAAVLSAAILVAMVGHILVEIALRSFFDSSTFVLDEFVGYGVAAMTFLTLAYALEDGALIRVRIVLARTGGRVRRWLELFCVAATLGLSVFLAAYVYRSVARNWQRGAVSQTIAEVPLWIPEGLVLLGLALFSVQLLAYMVRLLAGAPPIEEHGGRAE